MIFPFKNKKIIYPDMVLITIDILLFADWCFLHHLGGQRQPPYGTSWVPVALGILTALVTAVALALILLRKRRKETRFG